MKEVIAIVLFVFLIVFAVGGVIWMFVAEDLRTKNHIKFLIELEKIDKGKKDKEIKHEHIKEDF
jgi:hypothetical protein